LAEPRDGVKPVLKALIHDTLIPWPVTLRWLSSTDARNQGRPAALAK